MAKFWPFLAKQGPILNFRQKRKSSHFRYFGCTASCKKTVKKNSANWRTHGRTWIRRSCPPKVGGPKMHINKFQVNTRSNIKINLDLWPKTAKLWHKRDNFEFSTKEKLQENNQKKKIWGCFSQNRQFLAKKGPI